ncbi:MAG TPA: hypothetical protein VKA84_04195, partial [Gemmatimonadaceae bacterium]|nr:hypothetical protein [Gemmatimonadaceae bacterium]
VVAADRGALPAWVRRLYDWPAGDKVGHVLLLGALSLVLNLALRGRRWRPGGVALVRLGSLLLAVAITAEELSQARFPTRTLSAGDLACSYLGIWAGGLAATWVILRRRGIGAGTR